MADAVDGRKTVYHIESGAVQLPAVDATNAVSTHPGEWSETPWSPEDAATARKAKHEEQVAIAKEQGVDPPPPPVELEVSDADKAMLAADAKSRKEAAERIAKYDAEKKVVEDRDAQYKMDKALVSSPPPAVERRPFGRPGQMTPAEREAARKRAERLAGDNKPAAMDAHVGGSGKRDK